MENRDAKINAINGVLGVFILLIAALVLKILYPVGHNTLAAIFLLSRIYIWLILFLTIIYAHKIEKDFLLIWEEEKKPFSRVIRDILLLFVAIYISDVIVFLIVKYFHLARVSAALQMALLLFKSNFLLMLFTCVTAGVTEELLFRGYIQTRLTMIFGNPWWGIIIASFLFAAMHLGYKTAGEFLGTFGIGIIFSYYYWKYRNLTVLMITHSLYDFLTILIQIHYHR